MGWGRQIGQINFGTFRVFLAELSAPILVVSPLSMFSIISTKTKPLVPKEFEFKIFIWDWDLNLNLGRKALGI